MGKFQNFLKDLQEETTAGDIASVDSKLGDKAVKRAKPCKEHNEINCKICSKKDNK